MEILNGSVDGSQERLRLEEGLENAVELCRKHHDLLCTAEGIDSLPIPSGM